MKPRFQLTPPVLKVAEKHVAKACLHILALRHYWTARLHAGSFTSPDGLRWIKGVDKGVPDYAVLHEFYPGFLLEVKRPRGKARTSQEQKHFEIRLGYSLAICVCDSSEYLAEWLNHHEEEARRLWSHHHSAREEARDA